MTADTNVLIVGVGGLGAAMVHEALERGTVVAVLVRDPSTLAARLGEGTVARLARVTVGDAKRPATLDAATRGVDVVLSGKGADRTMARELAAAVGRSTATKLCWPAGGTNVMAEDGETPAYLDLLDDWPGAADAYRAHQGCIDEIRAAGVNHMIMCPGRMEAVGRRSLDVAASVRVNRLTGRFTSYEDAAWVMLQGALTDSWDRELVSVSPR